MAELQRDRVGQVVDDVGHLAGGEVAHCSNQSRDGFGAARVYLVKGDVLDHAERDVPIRTEPAADVAFGRLDVHTVIELAALLEPATLRDVVRVTAQRAVVVVDGLVVLRRYCVLRPDLRIAHRRHADQAAADLYDDLAHAGVDGFTRLSGELGQAQGEASGLSGACPTHDRTCSSYRIGVPAGLTSFSGGTIDQVRPWATTLSSRPGTQAKPCAAILSFLSP